MNKKMYKNCPNSSNTSKKDVSVVILVFEEWKKKEKTKTNDDSFM